MTWRIRATGYDVDALAYFARVEGSSGDNQALETSVKDAINSFVVGCKTDGIWDAIKASCILAGARTLNGALQPLVGTAPTNFNFTAGDYSRIIGLRGNGSTKYLNSNRNNAADPQDSFHLAAYATTAQNGGWIGAGVAENGASALMPFTVYRARSRNATLFTSSITIDNGFFGTSRSSSTEFLLRGSSTNVTVTLTSEAPFSDSLLIFARGPSSSPADYTASRLSFYSIGESLDLALLDTRVSTLMTEIGAAIP